jgi:diaminopimelate epimerase
MVGSTMVRVNKYDAWGNDFLVLDVAEIRPVSEMRQSAEPAAGETAVRRDSVDWPSIARAWCDRSTGIGADGLLLLDRIDDVNARMRLFNSDGSAAEMSGNGARCFAFALFRADAARGERSYRLHTDAGERAVTVGQQRGDTVIASIDMGEVTTIEAPNGWHAVGTHPDRPVMHLSVGNSHTVVGVEDVDAIDLQSIGRQVPHVNLEVVSPGPGTNAITMRVHERGAGITQACGTGACASAWAAKQWGIVVPAGDPGEVVVHMPGGDAIVTLDAPVSGRVTLTGGAQYVGTFEAALQPPYVATSAGTVA